MPQYMLLIYIPPDVAPEDAAPMEAWSEYTQALIGAGALTAGDALEGIDTATTVRVRDGETMLTDGPFAETKENLAGYYAIDVPDLDAAVKWAARLPSAPYGSVEVRPVMVFPEAGSEAGTAAQAGAEA